METRLPGDDVPYAPTLAGADPVVDGAHAAGLPTR